MDVDQTWQARARVDPLEVINFGGDQDPCVNFGSLFNFLDRCGIGDFWTFVSISHTVNLCHTWELTGVNKTVGAVVQLVEYRTRSREVAGSTHTRSTASNVEQAANLLCAQANSASYPQRDGK